MKTRTGFVSNSSSSSFVCFGCRLTPEIKKHLKAQFPMEKNESNEKEEEWDWLDRISEQLDLDLITMDGKYIIGKSLASGEDYLETANYSIQDLQLMAAKLQQTFGETANVKLYMGTEAC